MIKPKILYSSLRSKSILLKLLLSYLSTAILSVLVVAVLFVYWVKKEGSEDISSITRLALSNVLNMSVNYFESGKRISYEIYNNTSVKNLLLSINKDANDKINAADYIDKLKVSNPYIFSVYICDDRSIVFGTAQRSDYEENYETISRLIKTGRVLFPIPRQVKNNQNQKINLYTIIYHEANVGDERIGSSVVVNLNASWLHQQVYNTSEKPKQDIVFFDNHGNILIAGNTAQFSTNVSNEYFFKEVFDSTDGTGSFYSHTDKEKRIYNFVLDNQRNFAVLSISDYNSFFNKITRAQNTTIFVCSFILVAIILLSVILSQKLFTPINNVFFNIRMLFSNAATNDKQLMQASYITQAISNVIERLNNLENDSMNSYQIMRNDFIRGLLTSTTHAPEENLNKNILKYKLLDDLSHPYCIVVLRLDNFKNFFCKNTKEAIVFQLNSIGNIVSESLKPAFQSTYCDINDEHIAMIVYDSEQRVSASNESILTNTIKNCQEPIRTLLNLEMTAGISSFSDKTSDMKSRYDEAFSLTNYRLVYGKQSVLNKSSVKPEDVKNDKITYYIDSAVTAIKNNSLEAFTGNLNQLFSVISPGSYEKIVKILFQLANSILLIPIELQSSYANSFEYDIEDLYMQIKGFEDFRDLEEWFVALFLKTNNIITSIKNKKTPDLVDAVIKYLGENYCESNLSANLMAEKLSITPQYFSKIFNEYTGMSFPDYVNNVRLEKAKELLLSNSKLGIHEICEKVGYNNRTYFTTAFTKKYGLPPAKFKNSQNFEQLK